MALARVAGAGEEHAVLAYLVDQVDLSTAAPLDLTPGLAGGQETALAALAYEAAPDSADRRWIPSRRRPSAGAAVPLA